MTEYIFDATSMGGGNKAINISQISNLYYEDSGNYKKVSLANPKISFSVNTTKLYIPRNPTSPGTTSSDFDELPYNTLILDDDYKKYVSNIISTTVDGTYIIICIRDNKNISGYIPDSSFGVSTNKTQIIYKLLNQDLHIFSTLSLNGGARAVYLSELYNYLENSSSTFNIPNDNLGIDTIVIDKEDSKYKNLTITMNTGGFIVVNIRIQDTNKIMNLNIEDGTFVYNIDNNVIGYKNINKNEQLYKCKVIVNKDVQLYHDYNHDITIYELLNYGNIMLHCNNKNYKTYFGPKYDRPNNISDVIINYGYIRFYKDNDCEIYGSISNSGKIFIYSHVIMHSRFSNDEEGKLIIETNGQETDEERKAGKLYFDITYNGYGYSFLINNKAVIDVKENGEIGLIGEPDNLKYSLKYIIFNNGVVKFDGLISNKFSQKEIYNDVNSIIYLENDFKAKDNKIKFYNNGVIISHDEDESVIEKLINKGRYLNITTMKYYRYQNDKVQEICLYDDLNQNNYSNIQELLFELNSLDIKHDVLITITYLLNVKYINNQYIEETNNEILRLIKIGLLKDWPYTPNIPVQPVKPPIHPPIHPSIHPPIHPPKPKYQPCCPCCK